MRRLALILKELRERGVRGIDEIAEHVNVASQVDGGDLDAIDERHVGRLGGTARLGQRGDRVVIGHTHDPNPGGGRTTNQLGGCEPPVRRGGVKVEVDHWTPRLNGTQRAGKRDGSSPSLTSFALAGPPCRRKSARYSRISISRWSRSSSANSRKICLPSESSKRSP